MAVTLLVDSDIFAFKAAARNQLDCEFGTYTWDENPEEEIDAQIATLAEKLDATKVIMCLTDADNFRYDVLPTYKHNRDKNKRPELLATVKKYLAEEYTSYIRPRLEADDCMGILATHPKLIPGDKIIVSEDKDMRTVPAKIYNPGRPELGVIEVTRQQAHGFHMWQTIVGDVTDGYTGCPGMGKADRYGDFANEVLECEPEEMWDVVLEAYWSKGYRDADALVQARCAKILTADCYDFKNKKPILWTPIHLHW